MNRKLNEKNITVITAQIKSIFLVLQNIRLQNFLNWFDNLPAGSTPPNGNKKIPRSRGGLGFTIG